VHATAARLAFAASLGCSSSPNLVDTLATRPVPLGPGADAGALGRPAFASWIPGATAERVVLRDDAFLGSTNIPPTWSGDLAAQYTVSLYVPRGFRPGSALSFVLVFGAMGANTAALPNYGPTADARNLLVMAVDPTQPLDNADGRNFESYYCALKLRSELQGDTTLGASSPFLVAGFSGGGKDAMYVGEIGGTATFAGVIPAGVNEDLATYAIGVVDNPTSLNLPFVIVNATDDSLVMGYTAGVIASMMQSGFTNVTLIPYTGGHVFPPPAAMEQAVDSILVKP
jgi:hypothetical protein